MKKYKVKLIEENKIYTIKADSVEEARQKINYKPCSIQEICRLGEGK